MMTATTGAPVGVAILGLGRWGGHWLRNFWEHAGARVMAIADPLPENLHRAEASLPSAHGVYVTTDWQAAIAQPGVSAVVVVTPAVTHFEVVTTALELGLHVLVEKPLTVTTAEAQLVCEVADRQQRILMVDHTYRFNAAVQQGQRLVQSGQLGDLRYAYATRTHLGPVRQDVDVMWDLAIHDLVILNHWVGSSPIQVAAKGQGWLQPDRGLADTVWAEITYANGFEATMHWAWANCDKQRRLGIVGSEGTLIFDELAVSPLQLYQGTMLSVDQRFNPTDQACRAIEVTPMEPLAQACDHFLDCVRWQQPSPIANGWQGLELVQTLEALARSIQRGGLPIEIPAIRSGQLVEANS
jgi:predicted dehydrogenase